VFVVSRFYGRQTGGNVNSLAIRLCLIAILMTLVLFFSPCYREAFHFSEEKRVQTSSAGGATSTTVQMHREYSSHVEQLVTINSSGSGNAPPLPPKKRHVKEYMAAVGKYSQPSEVEIFRKSMEA
jgi:hypothetical protein